MWKFLGVSRQMTQQMTPQMTRILQICLEKGIQWTKILPLEQAQDG